MRIVSEPTVRLGGKLIKVSQVKTLARTESGHWQVILTTGTYITLTISEKTDVQRALEKYALTLLKEMSL